MTHRTLHARLTLIVLAAVPAVSRAAPAPAPGNLLANPGFESGLAGWTPIGGTTAVVNYGSVNGPGVSVGTAIGGGSSYLRDSSGGAAVEQVVATGPIPGGTNVFVGGHFGGAGSDDARLVVRFLDSSGGELGRGELEHVTEPNRNFEVVLLRREGVFAPPAGTVALAARVEMRNNCCSGALGAADLVELELVATPVIPPAHPLDTELVVNGRFESGWTAGSPLMLNEPRGWQGQNSTVYVRPYSDVDPAAPSTLVSCLIGGGAPGTSCLPGGAGNLLSDAGGGGVLRQRIDVRGNTPSFSTFGAIALRVSGFLGGVGTNDDAARVDVTFRGENLVVLSPASPVGPVTREERNNQTVVLLEEREYYVPVSTAYIDVEVAFVNACCSGAQGLLDNVSAQLALPKTPDPVPLGVNLVQNPGFESGSLPGSPLQLDTTEGWRGANGSSVEILSYGSSGSVPASEFAALNGLGGAVAGDLGGAAVLTQSFDLSGSPILVDGSRLRVFASAWFGGVGNDNDGALLQVQFVNQAGVQVGGAGGLRTLPAVTAADRANVTTLIQRLDDFPVPPGARRMIVTLVFVNACCSGANGLADNVVLVAYDAQGPGFAYCPGDGSGIECPCGNHSAPGANEGCRNSLGVAGKLRATGTASISADSLVLEGSQMPNAPALYFQGTLQQNGGAGAVFGDGIRCAGGTILRLATILNVGGASSYPSGGEPAISVRGGVALPGTRTYQAWYRNAAQFCTSSTFNLTNGWQTSWRF